MKKKTNDPGCDRMKIGSNIRKWRNIKAVKQRELAAALHLSEAAVSNIENDLTDVTLSQLENISLLLNIPVEQLFIDPQENISGNSYISEAEMAKTQFVMEKEVLYAIIGSIQKKDEQIQIVLQDVLSTMKNMVSGNNRNEASVS
ncbi:MAG: helix-turn-helix transcriptional regulator [Ferruginibacter sp.]|nr:helix-turn-helix transcriptional regulator [Ferruginibacter sp.]